MRATIKPIVVVLLAILPLTAEAQNGTAGPPCSDQVSTMDITACVDKDRQLWDKRLNAAYQALLQFVDPGQREPLRKAQRLWIQYRDTNCGFYGAHEGSISQILFANCMWTMTRDRTVEMEQDARP